MTQRRTACTAGAESALSAVRGRRCAAKFRGYVSCLRGNVSRTSIVAVIAVATSPSICFAQVSGTVVDATTLVPIPNALVSVQASEQEALTDASGAFDLPLATGDVIVVAGAKGWFNAGQAVTAPASGLTLSLDQVSAAEDPAYQFGSPSQCSGCHPEQFSEWQDSPMAKAGLNTWVYDTYDGTGTAGGLGGFVYLRDSSLAAANPASECRSCHQPEPWVLDPYSALSPNTAPTPEVLHGVSCVVCHQIANIDESKPNAPGIWPDAVTFSKPFVGAPVMYGALGDVDYQSGAQMRASYQPQLPSVMCAACHQDKNDPDLDGDFEEDDGVISEPTYLEWLASPYADESSPLFATCAGCHMPPSSASAACAVLPDMMRPPGDVREHTFRGTSADFLENAVTVGVEATLSSGEVSATVTVVNDKTGHHVPTGVTIRNAILVVEAFREADGVALSHVGTQVIHDLGGVGDPAQGYFAGLPGKLYAKLNHDVNGDGPTFFTDATGITFDTRIPALASDVTQYTFAAPDEGGSVLIRARLVYRRSWRALVDAKSWADDGHGNPLEDLAPPHFGHLMAQAETTLDAGSGGAGGENGGGAGGIGGGQPQGGGGGDGTDSDDGCACSTSAQNERASSAIWLLVLLGLTRRARQRQ